MLKLRFKNNKHNAVWLVEPKVVLGRGSQNDLIITDDSVSDIHAEIRVDHENLTLVRRSAKGILSLNGKPVEKGARVKANDLITVGTIDLQVVDPKQESRKVEPTVVRTDESATSWGLKANHSALANRVFTLKTENIVGRSNDCDITLAAAHLSRRHAKLMVKEGLLYVKDLGSSNGTYLNGKRVTEARVKRGDDLRFDTLSFGVIGPADDMDKTTVRSVASDPAAGAAQAKAARASVPRKRVSESAKSVSPQAGSVTTVQETTKSSGRGPLIALGLLLVCVLAVLVVFQNDLI
jgi:pSer/pThr/pTyr-binding forkhead associated (FHA) protein